MDEQRVREIAGQEAAKLCLALTVVIIVLIIGIVAVYSLTLAQTQDLQRRVGSLEQQLEQRK